MTERNRPAAYELGRDVDVHEALTLARRATFDPGQFTKRVLYHEHGEVETLERWQARAVLVALAAREPDARWSGTAPHVTDFEREELKRVGLGRRVRIFTLRLADKPRDILVYLVDHGPASPQKIAAALNVQAGLYTGGLNVLGEVGLAERDAPGGNGWSATADGRRLVLEARAASEEVPDVS